MEGLTKALELVGDAIKQLDPPMEDGDQQTFLFNDGVIVVDYEPRPEGRNVKVQVLGGKPITIDHSIGL